MPDNKFEGWDELEKVETTNIADQKNEKFKEWDNLINIEKSEIDLHKSESRVKPVYANTNGTTSLRIQSLGSCWNYWICSILYFFNFTVIFRWWEWWFWFGLLIVK